MHVSFWCVGDSFASNVFCWSRLNQVKVAKTTAFAKKWKYTSSWCIGCWFVTVAFSLNQISSSKSQKGNNLLKQIIAYILLMFWLLLCNWCFCCSRLHQSKVRNITVFSNRWNHISSLYVACWLATDAFRWSALHQVKVTKITTFSNRWKHISSRCVGHSFATDTFCWSRLHQEKARKITF